MKKMNVMEDSWHIFFLAYASSFFPYMCLPLRTI